MSTNRSSVHRTGTISLLLAFLVAQACSTDNKAPTDPIEPAPTSGSLELTIEETGARPDTDGFDITITLATQAGPLVHPVQQGAGSLFLSDLPLGRHLLRVEGLAAHCLITGTDQRSFLVEAGKTTQLAVGIFCPGPGAVLVKTVTRGRDVGVPTYTFSIRGESSQEHSIGTNDSLLIEEEDLPAGTEWFMLLEGVPDNCLLDPSPTSIRNLRGATVRIEFTVACIPRSSRIAFESGSSIYITDGPEVVNLFDSQWISGGGPSLSPDRTRVVFSNSPDLIDFVLAVVNTDGSGFQWVTSDDGGSFVGSQAWSPDGSRIVFSKQTGEDSSEIYVMNADGSGVVRLTFGGIWNSSPAWSPDGTSIAFCRTVGDPFENDPDIYRMSAVDGSGITKVIEGGCDPAWSPDGSKIAVTLAGDLAVVGANGSGLTTLHAGDITPQQRSTNPIWSPDGSQIAYTGGSVGHRIWIVDFDGSAFGEAFPYRFGRAPSWR